MNNPEYFMNIALAEAEKCLELKLLTVGAVLVVNDEIAGSAHKENFHSYHTDHAETILLRNYFKNRNLRRGAQNIELYTTMEPCMMCLGFILHLPINKLYYAAKDPYGGACGILNDVHSLPLRHQNNPLQVIGGICEKEAKAQLVKFLDVNEQSFYKDKKNPLVEYILH